PARGLIEQRALDRAPARDRNAIEASGGARDGAASLPVGVDLDPSPAFEPWKHLWIGMEMKPQAGGPDVIPAETAQPPANADLRRDREQRQRQGNGGDPHQSAHTRLHPRKRASPRGRSRQGSFRYTNRIPVRPKTMT